MKPETMTHEIMIIFPTVTMFFQTALQLDKSNSNSPEDDLISHLFSAYPAALNIHIIPLES